MKFSLLLLSFLFAAISISAQNEEPLVCPVVRVAGPTAGPKDKLADGATAKFTAVLEPLKPEYQLKYYWQLSSGKIISGDGTNTIEVQNKIHYVTATVHIDGFRTDGICPQTASETVWWDVQPTAEKIKSFSGKKFEPTKYDNQFVGHMWPDTTLHIIFGHKKDTSTEAAQNKENEVLQWIADKIDRGRITTEHLYEGVDVVEFWRVPAGAQIPICAECEPKCPTLSVSGPAGIVLPGGLAEYTATIQDVGETANLQYVWSTSEGTIESGQGTSKIKVRIAKNGICPTVAVEVIGLPKDCPARASETASCDFPPQATKLDTFSLPLSSISKQRFQKIADAINNDPTSQLYVLIPSNKAVGDAFFARLSKMGLGDYDPPRITFVEANGTNKIVEVWLVPPGATPPPKCGSCDSSLLDANADDSSISPKPTKIDEVLDPLKPENIGVFKRIADAAKKDPFSQVYIFVASSPLEFEKLSKSIRPHLDKWALEDGRVTYLDWNSDRFFIQAWLVPPESAPPTCEGCEKLGNHGLIDYSRHVKCPSIAILTPTKISMPGSILVFRAQLTGKFPARAKYVWSVNAGKVISGQGTKVVRVRAPIEAGISSIRAYLTVNGLPNGCDDLTTVVAGIANQPLVDPYDRYGDVSVETEKDKLRSAFAVLEKYPKVKILIVKRASKNSRLSNKRIDEIRSFISNELKVDSGRYQLASVKGQNVETVIWFVKPGTNISALIGGN